MALQKGTFRHFATFGTERSVLGLGYRSSNISEDTRDEFPTMQQQMKMQTEQLTETLETLRAILSLTGE